MEWGFLLGLGAITLVVIGLVIYFGLMLNKAVATRAPEINLPLNITLSGNALLACIVTFWIYCVATRVLNPDSFLGTFLGKADGVAAVIAGSILFAGLAALILAKLGYPIARSDDRR